MEYIFTAEEDRTVFNEAYKQAVLSRMLVMGCNMDDVQNDLELHMKMSTGRNNPYPTTISAVTAQILTYETAKQKKGRKKETRRNNNGSDTEGKKGKLFWWSGNHPTMFIVNGTITSNRMIITSIPNMR